MSRIYQLFAGQGDNGDSESVQVRAGEHIIMGGGTFGGGTLAAEFSPDGGTTWVVVASMTAQGSVAFKVPPGRIRAALSGATTPDLNAWTAAIGGQDG